jgi:hypothetical protein
MEHDTIKRNEDGSASYTATWYHPTTGLTVTPTAVTWSLTDGDGAAINGRTDVSETPGATNTIVLAGDDLEILDQTNEAEYRVLTIHGDAADANIPIVLTIDLYVDNVDSIT